MSESKSEAVFLVPGDKTIYAVPVSVCEQYKLEGKSLEAAQIALSGDVVGQDHSTRNSRGETYAVHVTSNRGGGNTGFGTDVTYSRTPWND